MTAVISHLGVPPTELNTTHPDVDLILKVILSVVALIIFVVARKRNLVAKKAEEARFHPKVSEFISQLLDDESRARMAESFLQKYSDTQADASPAEQPWRALHNALVINQQRLAGKSKDFSEAVAFLVQGIYHNQEKVLRCEDEGLFLEVFIQDGNRRRHIAKIDLAATVGYALETGQVDGMRESYEESVCMWDLE